MAAKRPESKARKPVAKGGKTGSKAAAGKHAAGKHAAGKPAGRKSATTRGAAMPRSTGSRTAAAKPKARPAAARQPARVAAPKPAAVRTAHGHGSTGLAPASTVRARAGKGVVAIGVKTSTVLPAPLADGEENGGSLLAGPRNVTPYIAKRGEQYMNKAQLEHFQNILQVWKRDLMEEVDRTVSHMKDEAANFPDPNDRATQEEEFSIELRTRDRERKLIRKIDEALSRIEDGSYGYCLETGEEIGIKRLEARPVATLSIEAQERRERRERQYGDRDDRYR